MPKNLRTANAADETARLDASKYSAKFECTRIALSMVEAPESPESPIAMRSALCRLSVRTTLCAARAPHAGRKKNASARMP